VPPYAAPIELSALLPEILMVTLGCIVLLASQIGSDRFRAMTPSIMLLGLIIIGGVIFLAPPTEVAAGSGLVIGQIAQYTRWITLIFAIMLTLASWTQPKPSERGEYFSMMIFSFAGVMLVAAANDLLVLFLAVELVSIPTYVLIALSRSRAEATESATKYFFLGAMSAAIMAYGMSLLYGVGGGTNLDLVKDGVIVALNEPGTLPYWLASAGIVLTFAGLLFKIAAFPFHFYIADVYAGAASPVAGLLGFVPKFAGLIAIFHVMALTDWQTTSGPLFWMLWWTAAISMTVGNVLALRQTNIKRMLGYSGVAHSGYMLVGVLVGPLVIGGDSFVSDGTAAVLFYAVMYGLANLLAFAVLSLLRTRGRAVETLRDIAGLIRSQPTLALLMVLAMLVLMGIPPTAGFWGKMKLFSSALAASTTLEPLYHQWLIALVIIGFVNSAIGVAYYLRVAAACIVYENDLPATSVPRDMQQTGVLIIGVFLLVITFYPRDLMLRGRQATVELRRDVLLDEDSVTRSRQSLDEPPLSHADRAREEAPILQ
jgi:NADH-quinone oxidoreductase subunit N